MLHMVQVRKIICFKWLVFKAARITSCLENTNRQHAHTHSPPPPPPHAHTQMNGLNDIVKMLRIIFAFAHSKTAIPSIFCWYFRYFVSRTYLYFQVSIYICIHVYKQCSSLLLLMVWRYKRQYTNKTLTLRKVYEYTSELRKCSHFYILNCYFLQLFCSFFGYVVSET